MTQTSISSHVKSAIAITGAGPGIYLDAIADEIIRDFHKNQATQIGDIESNLRTNIHDFYTTHVVPLLPHLDREFSLIVAAQTEGEISLWITDATVVKRSIGFEAVGSGSPYARMAIETKAIDLDVKKAVLLAVRAVMEAKERDQYSGKHTLIVCIKDNLAYTIPMHLVDQTERLFKLYSGIEGSAFQYAIGAGISPEDARTQKISSWLQSLRNDFMLLTEQMLKDQP